MTTVVDAEGKMKGTEMARVSTGASFPVAADLNNDGKIDQFELNSAVEKYLKTSQSATNYRKVAGMLVCFLMVALALLSVLLVVITTLLKDVKVEGGQLVDVDTHEPVKTASADFSVSPEGTLIMADPDIPVPARGRRQLSDGLVGDHAVATAEVETSQTLHSGIKDQFLEKLKSISINYGDDHYKVQVLGFHREPSEHSNCGSVVVLATATHGEFVLDGEDLYHRGGEGIDLLAPANADLTARATHFGVRRLAAHEPDAHKGWTHLSTHEHRRLRYKEKVYGARKLQAANVLGVYAFFETVDFECTMTNLDGKEYEIEPPGSVALPLIYKAYIDHRCDKVPKEADENGMPLKYWSCESTMGEASGLPLPGNSPDGTTVREVQYVLHTEDYLVKVSRYPNHPIQSKVTVSDRSACATSGNLSEIHYQRLADVNNAYDDTKFFCFTFERDGEHECSDQFDWDSKYLAYLGQDNGLGDPLTTQTDPFVDQGLSATGPRYDRWRIANKALLDTDGGDGVLYGYELDVLVSPASNRMHSLTVYNATTQMPQESIPSMTFEEFKQGANATTVDAWLEEHIGVAGIESLEDETCPETEDERPLFQDADGTTVPLIGSIFDESESAVAYYSDHGATARNSMPTFREELDEAWVKAYDVYWGRLLTPKTTESEADEAEACVSGVPESRRSCTMLPDNVPGSITLSCEFVIVTNTTEETEADEDSLVMRAAAVTETRQIGPLMWYELQCDVARQTKGIGDMECQICDATDYAYMAAALGYASEEDMEADLQAKKDEVDAAYGRRYLKHIPDPESPTFALVGDDGEKLEVAIVAMPRSYLEQRHAHAGVAALTDTFKLPRADTPCDLACHLSDSLCEEFCDEAALEDAEFEAKTAKLMSVDERRRRLWSYYWLYRPNCAAGGAKHGLSISFSAGLANGLPSGCTKQVLVEGDLPQAVSRKTGLDWSGNIVYREFQGATSSVAVDPCGRWYNYLYHQYPQYRAAWGIHHCAAYCAQTTAPDYQQFGLSISASRTIDKPDWAKNSGVDVAVGGTLSYAYETPSKTSVVDGSLWVKVTRGACIGGGVIGTYQIEGSMTVGANFNSGNAGSGQCPISLYGALGLSAHGGIRTTRCWYERRCTRRGAHHPCVPNVWDTCYSEWDDCWDHGPFCSRCDCGHCSDYNQYIGASGSVTARLDVNNYCKGHWLDFVFSIDGSVSFSAAGVSVSWSLPSFRSEHQNVVYLNSSPR